MSQPLSLAEDLLKGIPAIATFLGLPQRRVYYLAHRKLLPLFKTGDVWCGRKSTLLRHYEQLEQANRGAAA